MEMIELTNGKSAPKACVDAMTEFEKIWPGASFVNARPGLVVCVLEAYKAELKKEMTDDG